MTSAYFKSLLIYWIYEVIEHYVWGIAFPFNIWTLLCALKGGVARVGARGKFISEKYSISWLLYRPTNNGVAWAKKLI